MRRLVILAALLAFSLLVACGGGDDDDSGDGGSGDRGPTASNDASSDGGSGGGGASSDFCSPDDIEFVFDSLDFTNATGIADQADALDDALSEWVDRAPREIAGDVEVVADGVRGMLALLEEYDYNFLTVGTQAANDPRLAELESDRFMEASAHLEEYCGFDISTPAVSQDGGSDAGGSGTGATTSGTIPEGFPEELVPPDSTVGLAGNFGGALTAQFHSTATMEQIRDVYEEALGDPTVIDSMNLVWSVFADGRVTAVTVSGTDGDVTIGISIAGG